MNSSTDTGGIGRYAIVSPVKDEVRYVSRTLDAVARQTVRPVRWVIVDDGSSDGTLEIIRQFANANPFVDLIETPEGGERAPGSAVINAFNRGLEQLQGSGCAYDYLVKLDCDLSFEANYFEELLERFEEDERLGIASGIYQESRDGEDWSPIPLPSYHAAGASKVVRRACFEEIGGFQPVRGWDTIDEIRAMTKGWRTRHFSELRMKHWKTEGAGIGPLRTNFMHGEIYYLTGGSKLFFLLKAIHRVATRPYVVASAALVWGYLKAMLRRAPLLVTKEEARHYRALLLARLFGRAKAA